MRPSSQQSGPLGEGAPGEDGVGGEGEEGEVLVTTPALGHHHVPVLAQSPLPPVWVVTDIDKEGGGAKMATVEVKTRSNVRDCRGGDSKESFVDTVVALSVVEAHHSQLLHSFPCSELLVPLPPLSFCLFQPRLSVFHQLCFKDKGGEYGGSG